MTGSGITIRPAHRGDVTNVLALTLQMGGHEKDARRAGAESLLCSTFESPQARALVAEVAGRVVGYAELHARLSLFRGGREAWLSALVVDPTLRRSGIGRALMEGAEIAACLLGCESLALESSDWRTEAHDFYRSLGFHEQTPAVRFLKPAPCDPPGNSLGRQFLVAAAAALSSVTLALSRIDHPSEGVGADGAATTGADWSAENAALACLAPLGLPIVSEESGLFGGRLPGPGEAWICLDPLDGSRNQRAGMPPWSTAIGLVRDGKPIAGAVAEHSSGRRWWAAEGHGAWVDGRPAAPKLSDLAIVPSPEPGDFVGVLPGYSRIRISGSTASDLCRVADGSAAVFFGLERPVVHSHDLAGPAAILQEAGACALSIAGRMPSISADPRRTYLVVAAYSDEEASRLIGHRPALVNDPAPVRR